MKISKERLEKESANTGFRPEVLEKVIHLIELLNDFSKDEYLSKRIALKGGSASHSEKMKWHFWIIFSIMVK